MVHLAAGIGERFAHLTGDQESDGLGPGLESLRGGPEEGDPLWLWGSKPPTTSLGPAGPMDCEPDLVDGRDGDRPHRFPGRWIREARFWPVAEGAATVLMVPQ